MEKYVIIDDKHNKKISHELWRKGNLQMKKVIRKMQDVDIDARDIMIIIILLIVCMIICFYIFELDTWATSPSKASDTTETEESSTTVSEVEESSRAQVSSEELIEPSSELPEEYSAEESIEPLDEFSDESAVEVGGALELSEEEFRLLCYVAYAEAGSESRECLIGTIWNMRNGAEKKNEGDFISYLTFPARYSVVQEDGSVLSGDGIVTDSMISEDFRNLVRKVLSGEIPDLTRGYECYVAYELMDHDKKFTDPDEFAEFYGITDYVVLGKHIFFPEEQWPEAWN